MKTFLERSVQLLSHNQVESHSSVKVRQDFPQKQEVSLAATADA